MFVLRVGCRSSRLRSCFLVNSQRSHTSAVIQQENSDDKPRKRQRKAKVQPLDELAPATLLDDSAVHKFLAHLKDSTDTVSIEEFEERYRPKKPLLPEYSGYEQSYKALQENIADAFNLKQLQHIIQLYGLEPPQFRQKWNYATAIIEQAWGYPSLHAVDIEKQDRTVQVTESFALQPFQSFLLLGKDGSDLHALAAKYKAQITMTSNPLTLKATGFRGSIKAIGQHIALFKQNILDEVYDLPTEWPVRPDLLQKVSRLAGAFTENHADGKLRISYKSDSPKSVLLARRLATRASCESAAPEAHELLAHVSPTTSTSTDHLSSPPYSFYPFLSSRSLPWTTEGGVAFRLRRVGEWSSYGQHLPMDDTLFEDNGNDLSLSESYRSVRSILESLEAFKEGTTITASLGHVLIISPASKSTLLPPLAGNFPVPAVFSWLREHPLQSVFIPSVPAPVIDRTSSFDYQNVLHRLVYRVIRPRYDNEAQVSSVYKTLKFEILLNVGKEELLESADDTRPSLNFSTTISTESSFDLMLPDRPVDVQLSVVKNATTLPRPEWPEELDTYVSALEEYLRDRSDALAQPETPLSFELQGERFILHQSASVRQRRLDGDNSVIESLLDLESNEKTNSCQVHCPLPSDEAQWSLLVKTCDRLTSTSI